MGKLEREFNRAVAKHKTVIIRVALELRHEELYSNPLLEDFKRMYNDIAEYEKSARVENDIYHSGELLRDFSWYDKVYELCWEAIKESIPNSRIF